MKKINDSPLKVFSEAEHRELNAVLSEFPKKEVLKFVFQAQMVCMAVFKKSGRTEHKQKFRKMQKAFDRAREHLEVVGRETGPAFRPIYESRLSDVVWTVEQVNNIDSDPDFQANCTAVALAKAALKNLEELEAIFEENLDRSALGTVHEEFGAAILEHYRRYLGEPASSVNDPFPHVLAILFKAVQIELKAPEKLAAKLLKNYPAI